jgi:FkbM family methyltransferase
MVKIFQINLCKSQVIPYVMIAYLYGYILILHRSLRDVVEKIEESWVERLPSESRLSGIRQKNVEEKFSRLQNASEKWTERISNLETKLNAYLAFNSDPFEWTNKPATCRNMTALHEYCNFPGCRLDTMYICLDDIVFNKCTVYDFGLREQPFFGFILSRFPFLCNVYAFDPSPITEKWFESNKQWLENPNYHYYSYGGGGADETITLREYNWEQVSIYSYPHYVVANPRNCTNSHCRFQKFPPQKIHSLPVRSLESLMAELKHDWVDVLKLDVEGSEYRILEGMIDHGSCRKVQQMTLEWHHYNYDVRYGASSVPILNVFSKLLKEKCGLQQFWLHDTTGWPSNEELYIDMKLTLMYNLASFRRV